MKRIYKISTTVLASFLLFACDLDVNTDPNNPTSESVKPDLMIAGALKDSYGAMPTTGNRLGNIMTQAWAGDITNYTGAFQTEFSLDISTGFYSGMWSSLYLTTGTFATIIANEEPEYTYYNAISRIMKAYYFQYIVDLYGDVPYTEAHGYGENVQPAYDDDEVIYGTLLEEINAAISLINNPPSEAIAPGAEDIVMGGNMDMWKKFANTLKLRILLRQESTNAYNGQFSSLNGPFIGAGESVTINPGYTNSEGKRNPFYDQFFTLDDATNSTYILYVPADYTAKFLTGQTTQNGVETGIYDPRVARLFVEEDGSINGVIQGENEPAGATPLSHLGPGLLTGADQDGYIMTSAESLFLQAEAVQRGLLGGNAADLFRQGIRESFELLGIGDQADAYIAQSESRNLIGWTGSSNKIEAIMTQKWIANMGIHGLESWIEYTRTGFPDFPLPTIAQQSTRFNRLMYPQSEYVGNGDNVPSQTSNDTFTTHIFWDQN